LTSRHSLFAIRCRYPSWLIATPTCLPFAHSLLANRHSLPFCQSLLAAVLTANFQRDAFLAVAVVTLARLVASDAVGGGVSTELAELFGVTSGSVVRSIVGNGRGIGVALGAEGLVVAISASLRLPLHRFSVVHRKTLRVGHGQTVTAVATVPPMT
jgi:hypothetical protein